MRTHAIVLALLVALAPLANAAGGGGSNSAAPGKAVDPDFNKAEKAIQAKDWAPAVALLTQVVARDNKNADAYNYLGFAERNRGNLDVAFKHYEQALTIDPKHRGAREYLGEAYLIANNLPKAEEQLAALDKLCTFSCSEYRELKEKIGDYKQKQLAANKPR
jgi:tetratricopeptide (TPR) repeat protein